MSVKFAFTAEDDIVEDGVNELTILNVPLPEYGMEIPHMIKFFRGLAAVGCVIGIPLAAYWGFKGLSEIVSVPVLMALSAAFVFVCWKIANRIDARRARASSGDNP